MSTRYESLDAWRGVACLVVIVFHTTGYRDGSWIWSLTALGWIGVPLFFVISGYCISAAADNHLAKGRSIRDFAWRRWRRIFPPYLAILALSAAVTPLLHTLPLFAESMRPGPWRLDVLRLPSDLTLAQWIGSATLTEGWRYHFI